MDCRAERGQVLFPLRSLEGALFIDSDGKTSGPIGPVLEMLPGTFRLALLPLGLTFPQRRVELFFGFLVGLELGQLLMDEDPQPFGPGCREGLLSNKEMPPHALVRLRLGGRSSRTKVNSQPAAVDRSQYERHTSC